MTAFVVPLAVICLIVLQSPRHEIIGSVSSGGSQAINQVTAILREVWNINWNAPQRRCGTFIEDDNLVIDVLAFQMIQVPREPLGLITRDASDCSPYIRLSITHVPASVCKPVHRVQGRQHDLLLILPISLSVCLAQQSCALVTVWRYSFLFHPNIFPKVTH